MPELAPVTSTTLLSNSALAIAFLLWRAGDVRRVAGSIETGMGAVNEYDGKSSFPLQEQWRCRTASTSCAVFSSRSMR
jgi:hypothetical protein